MAVHGGSKPTLCQGGASRQARPGGNVCPTLSNTFGGRGIVRHSQADIHVVQQSAKKGFALSCSPVEVKVVPPPNAHALGYHAERSAAGTSCNRATDNARDVGNDPLDKATLCYLWDLRAVSGFQ